MPDESGWWFELVEEDSGFSPVGAVRWCVRSNSLTQALAARPDSTARSGAARSTWGRGPGPAPEAAPHVAAER